MKQIPAFTGTACLHTHIHAYPQNTTSFRGASSRFINSLNNFFMVWRTAGAKISKRFGPFLLYTGRAYYPDPFCKIRDA
jgi:hypothetical protein